MSDAYQAVFDATRTSLGNTDVCAAFSEIVRQAFDISYEKSRLEGQFQTVAYEWQRPAVLFRPSLSIDGNQEAA
jgi:hypothetical protein